MQPNIEYGGQLYWVKLFIDWDKIVAYFLGTKWPTIESGAIPLTAQELKTLMCVPMQPAVRLTLALQPSRPPRLHHPHPHSLDLMLDLKSFEELRYSVAKTLSLTDQFKTK